MLAVLGFVRRVVAGRRVRVTLRLGHRDQHALDARSIAELDHELARAVRRARNRLHARGLLETAERFEPLAQLFGQVRHFFRLEHAATHDPAEDLPSAIARLAERFGHALPVLRQARQRIELGRARSRMRTGWARALARARHVSDYSFQATVRFKLFRRAPSLP